MSFRWRHACLWLWAALSLAGAPSAQAAAPAQRLAVVLSGPMRLIEQVQQELTLPLSAEANIVQTSAYRKAAAAIGIRRHPRSNRAAPWVGRALQAQYVLLIDAIELPGAGGAQDFMGVRLIDSATSKVLHEQRYFLPGGALTPSVAAAMLQRIVPLLRGARPGTPADDFAPRPVAAPTAKPTGVVSPAGTGVPRDTPPERISPRGRVPMGPGTLPPPSQLGDRRHTPAGAVATGRKHPRHAASFTLGPRMVWRRAQLTPTLPSGSAVPYGAGRGLGQPLLGGGAELSLFWRRVGLQSAFALFAGKHSTHVGSLPETGRAEALHLDTQVAVQLLAEPMGDAAVSVRLGTRYDRMPIDVGPFVGLSSIAATAGLAGATPKLFHHLQLRGTVDGIFLGRLGLEAARAGRPHLAQGLRVQLQPRIIMGAWHGTLHLAFDYRVAHFTGATALFSHARYQAMALSDTHVSMGIDFGGSF